MNSLPENGFLRLSQIIGCKRKGEQPIIPVSKATWWAGVKSGRFPKPTKALGQRITAWKISDIRKLVESLGNAEVQE